tara:strand:- start:2395 stop:2550 length:156 start_codon:yes stop_codon:yes gene_type:complete
VVVLTGIVSPFGKNVRKIQKCPKNFEKCPRIYIKDKIFKNVLEFTLKDKKK